MWSGEGLWKLPRQPAEVFGDAKPDSTTHPENRGTLPSDPHQDWPLWEAGQLILQIPPDNASFLLYSPKVRANISLASQ